MTDSEEPRRRQDDPRIEQLVKDVDRAKGERRQMQTSLDENTELTVGLQREVGEVKKAVGEMNETVGQIRDLMASFRVLKAVAVWVSAMVAAVGAGLAGWHQIFKR